jgi:hypothetical protein
MHFSVWIVMPYGLAEIYQHFRGTHCSCILNKLPWFITLWPLSWSVTLNMASGLEKVENARHRHTHRTYWMWETSHTFWFMAQKLCWCFRYHFLNTVPTLFDVNKLFGREGVWVAAQWSARLLSVYEVSAFVSQLGNQLSWLKFFIVVHSLYKQIQYIFLFCS